MNRQVAERLKKTYKIVGRITEGTVTATVALLLLWLMLLLAGNLLPSLRPVADGISADIIKGVAVGLLCLFLLAVAARMILSLFVKSDEEEAFEAKVDYVLKQKKQQKQPTVSKQEIKSPLVHLTAEEEETVCRLLSELPPHISNAHQINMAIVSQYLTALKNMDCLNDNDIYNLYAWVGKVTDKELPDFNHFNEAYPSTTARKVAKAKEHIERELQKLR